jgi:non-specific serine/threonine protein kinase
MDWSEAIIEAIEASRVMVLVLSHASNESPQVKREIERAVHHRMPIVPFRVEEVFPSGAMEYFLSTPHWLNATSQPEQHLEMLAAHVLRMLNRIAPQQAAAGPEMLPTPPAIATSTQDQRDQDKEEQEVQKDQEQRGPEQQDAVRNNLPQSLTPFIGRCEQVQEWRALLTTPGMRLMTLAGFGGIGKTRTALQIAFLCVDDFADGVWWIPLDTVTTGDAMAQQIAEQLRLHLKPQPTVREQLWDFHRDRELLLVLDNTEQIQGSEASEVVEGLLDAGPRVKCLITSRRSLEIRGEHLVEMDPLPLSEAEALFLERARTRKSSFTLNEQNAATVSAICSRLEGIPLAIEIAASLIVLLSPAQVLKRLDDQLRLTARDPSLPPRQQALRAAIDWSYKLLTKNAQTLFAQLAVFSGGLTVEAAEEVCSGHAVLDGLLELRSHSLLRVETDELTQQERLVMLKVLNEYAVEKLAEEKLTDPDVRRRHAKYFCAWAQKYAEQLRTEGEAASLRELQAEFDNLRVALDWAVAHNGELAAQLALVFSQPLSLLGFWPEARQALEKGWGALQRSGAPNGEIAACIQFHLASLAVDIGDHVTARAQAEASLVTYCALDDSSGTARALNLLGLLATEDNDTQNASHFFEEALSLWPPEQETERLKTLHNLARLAARQGDNHKARTLYAAILAQRRQSGDLRGQATTLGNLGALAQVERDYAGARSFYEESLHAWRTLRDPLGIAVALHNLGELAVSEHDAPRAVVLFVHAERMFHDLSSPYSAESANALEQLREHVGAEEYATLRRRAELTAWEDVL